MIHPSSDTYGHACWVALFGGVAYLHLGAAFREVRRRDSVTSVDERRLDGAANPHNDQSFAHVGIGRLLEGTFGLTALAIGIAGAMGFLLALVTNPPTSWPTAGKVLAAVALLREFLLVGRRRIRGRHVPLQARRDSSLE